MMSPTVDVEVLLATYNGERYLREQIDSILGQTYSDLRILARDDGSTDGTAEILKFYQRQSPHRFRILPPGPRPGGAGGNFLLLMRASTAGYVAFSDQDDVWYPDKIETTKHAMMELEAAWGSDTPLLVFTDLKVVDETLNTLYDSFWRRMRIDPNVIENPPALLVQGVVTGCTSMLNRSLIDRSVRMPETTALHDRWISVLASMIGKTRFLRAQTMLYRQHDRNVIGLGHNRSGDRIERLRRYGLKYNREWADSQHFAAAFLETHGPQLSERDRFLLSEFLLCESSKSRWVRIYKFIRHGFRYATTLPNLVIARRLWTSRQT